MTSRGVIVAMLGAVGIALSAVGVAQAQGECPNADTPTADTAALEAAVECLVAQERAAAGVPQLTPVADLRTAARDHAADMVSRKYFDVRSPSGELPGARADRFGYGDGALGAQVAAMIGFGGGTSASPRAVFASWMTSATNRGLIRGNSVRDIGIGAVRGAPLAAGENPTTYVVYLGSLALAIKPVLGKSVAAEALSGSVGVAAPGANLISLNGVISLPLGSRVDTRNGKLRMAAASNAQGAIQRADLKAGTFKVGETRGAAPVTELTLSQSLPSCKRKPSAKRRLWAVTGAGRFRTIGKYATATVLSGRWLTEDSCKGTRVTVTSGSASVRDRRSGRTRMVRAGTALLVRR